jgi:hypothetical protein
MHDLPKPGQLKHDKEIQYEKALRNDEEHAIRLVRAVARKKKDENLLRKKRRPHLSSHPKKEETPPPPYPHHLPTYS